MLCKDKGSNNLTNSASDSVPGGCAKGWEMKRLVSNDNFSEKTGLGTRRNVRSLATKAPFQRRRMRQDERNLGPRLKTNKSFAFY